LSGGKLADEAVFGTRVFLWQEGHCAFATEEEAIENMDEMIQVTRSWLKRSWRFRVLVGGSLGWRRLPEREKTMAIEGLMPDGKALQCGLHIISDRVLQNLLM
jgi:prolyl-tRNA synthetase